MPLRALRLIGRFFKKIYQVFTSDKAKAIFEQIDDLVPQVTPIVNLLIHIDPKTCTIDDIIGVYKEFGRTLGTISNDRVGFGNALLNLAVSLVKDRYPNIPTHLIQGAINLALAGLRSEK